MQNLLTKIEHKHKIIKYTNAIYKPFI